MKSVATQPTPLTRAIAALLHPVTLAAIGVLLVNDHVFKQAWAGSWWTGKLSDLAWMVFAPPALACVVALVLPRSPRWTAVAFWTAYGGLGALYLAYNLNEPLHDAIMGGFALLTGATPSQTSPFDPTDAIVIPPALAIGAWVWRRASQPPRFARQGALVVVTVAALASVATSYVVDNVGITTLEHQGGRIVASTCQGGGAQHSFVTADGGHSWTKLEEPSKGQCSLRAMNASVETPRGTVHILSGMVQVERDGQRETVFSKPGNDSDIVQRMTKLQAFERGTTVGLETYTGAFQVAYDSEGDTVVVAMGVEGVAVWNPDGGWSRVAVGPFQPTDTSVSMRLGYLFSDTGTWALAICAVLLAHAVAWNAMASTRRWSQGNAERFVTAAGWAFVLGGAAGAVLVSWVYVSEQRPEAFFSYAALFASIPTAIVTLIGLAIAAPSARRPKSAWSAITTACLGVAAVLVPLMLWSQSVITSQAAAVVVAWLACFAVSWAPYRQMGRPNAGAAPPSLASGA